MQSVDVPIEEVPETQENISSAIQNPFLNEDLSANVANDMFSDNNFFSDLLNTSTHAPGTSTDCILKPKLSYT
jgi:hypothetical protein